MSPCSAERITPWLMRPIILHGRGWLRFGSFTDHSFCSRQYLVPERVCWSSPSLRIQTELQLNRSPVLRNFFDCNNGFHLIKVVKLICLRLSLTSTSSLWLPFFFNRRFVSFHLSLYIVDFCFHIQT